MKLSHKVKLAIIKGVALVIAGGCIGFMLYEPEPFFALLRDIGWGHVAVFFELIGKVNNWWDENGFYQSRPLAPVLDNWFSTWIQNQWKLPFFSDWSEGTWLESLLRYWGTGMLLFFGIELILPGCITLRYFKAGKGPNRVSVYSVWFWIGLDMFLIIIKAAGIDFLWLQLFHWGHWIPGSTVMSSQGIAWLARDPLCITSILLPADIISRIEQYEGWLRQKSPEVVLRYHDCLSIYCLQNNKVMEQLQLPPGFVFKDFEPTPAWVRNQLYGPPQVPFPFQVSFHDSRRHDR